MRLEGRSTLITGAARGIGRGFAEAYAAEGATVAVADIDRDAAEAAAAAIGERAYAVHLDVTDQASIDAAIEAVVARAGKLDVLVNGAALFAASRTVDIDRATAERLHAVNVAGTLFTMQAAARRMIAQGHGGKIVNMATQAGRRGEPLVLVYCATKAAVISMTQSAGLDLIAPRHQRERHRARRGRRRALGARRRDVRRARGPRARREAPRGRGGRARGPLRHPRRPRADGGVPRLRRQRLRRRAVLQRGWRPMDELTRPAAPPSVPPVPLSDATLARLPADVSVPTYDRARLTAGIVHIGLGNFHRAHQAWYLHRLMQRGLAQDWAIVGAGVRPADAAMRERLLAQDCLTTLLELAPGGVSAEVIGSMIDFVPVEPGHGALVARMAAPDIRIVSLTVTEGGYYVDPATGGLDADHADIRHDAAHPDAPRTAFGAMVAALARRRAAGVPAFACLSCDNLAGNGGVLRRAVAGLARLLGPGPRRTGSRRRRRSRARWSTSIATATGPAELALVARASASTTPRPSRTRTSASG